MAQLGCWGVAVLDLVEHWQVSSSSVVTCPKNFVPFISKEDEGSHARRFLWSTRASELGVYCGVWWLWSIKCRQGSKTKNRIVSFGRSWHLIGSLIILVRIYLVRDNSIDWRCVDGNYCRITPQYFFRKVLLLQPELRAAHCIKMCHNSTSVNLQSDSMPRVYFLKAHGVDLQLELKTKFVISQPKAISLRTKAANMFISGSCFPCPYPHRALLVLMWSLTNEMPSGTRN